MISFRDSQPGEHFGKSQQALVTKVWSVLSVAMVVVAIIIVLVTCFEEEIVKQANDKKLISAEQYS